MPASFLCIHGHFYQPPREDPITGTIPAEMGAEPFSNWNERIHHECYKPNADLGNFERISFNIGPTLYSWLNHYDPASGAKIVAQTQAVQQRHGVSNAMAQAYNHTILPLARRRDKETQVYWGMAEFEHRYGHKPQGMWLPETAADLETLVVLAQLGIQFTILAPWQAESNDLDVTEPYKVYLPTGSAMNVFFYQRDLSGNISFNPWTTEDAERFLETQVRQYFNPEKEKRSEPQLLMIASDGELYGHHQRLREYFLKKLTGGEELENALPVTYPALWLKQRPPRQAVKIREATSWSCHHGVMRWKGQCGCTPGDGRWKFYFRQSFDNLGEELDGVYASFTRSLWIDPWRLRNRYIEVILGQTPVEQLIRDGAGRALTSEQDRSLRLLLRAQYERQRMFTSCGWFFEDFSRIEPKNNVAYAVQAAHLTRLATGIELLPRFLEDMKNVFGRNGIRGDLVARAQLARVEAALGEEAKENATLPQND